MDGSAAFLIVQAVDAIAAYDGRGIPAGAAAAIARGVAILKGAGCDGADLHAAEALSMEVHRLSQLISRRDEAADDEAALLKHRLPDRCWAWVSALPLGYASGAPSAGIVAIR